jgi:hypothetical protein
VGFWNGVSALGGSAIEFPKKSQAVVLARNPKSPITSALRIVHCEFQIPNIIKYKHIKERRTENGGLDRVGL